MRTVHVLIKGKVQGVFFRASAKEKAEQLNIHGWVRNTPAGDVEMMAAGSDNSIESLIQWCHDGPSKAKVDKVVIEEKDPEIFDGFKIIRG